MKSITFRFMLIMAMALFSAQSFAVTAFPEQINFKQPDGKSLTIQMMGDEFMHWAKTSDGYTIMFNKDGFYEYATLDQKGDMIPSGVVATDPENRKGKDQAFVSQLTKDLFYSKSQLSVLESIKQMRDKEAKASKAFPTTGNRRLIVILMSTPDKPFTKTRNEFNNLFNQIGYNAEGGMGSVKDLYSENSRGQLNLTTDVVGPYTANQNMAYYGNNTNGNARALISEAINKANPIVNYANYDNDNDGNVDGIYVIFAGHGEEAGGGADCIWSHKWGISPVYLDGVRISTYACSPELRGAFGTSITHIGVICHEFGHVMGSRDFYDTNGSAGGAFTGTGSWDLMAGGSWNGGGATPAHHNPYNKIYLFNWATAKTLTSRETVTLHNAEYNNSYYRINTRTANEYFLLENRQKVGFDVGLAGHGLVVFHVNGNNLSNQSYPQGLYPVCASATTNPTYYQASYGRINSGGCPFPGTTNKTALTDVTIPNMKSWAGANTNKPITNIVESNGVISFDFMGGGVELRDPENPANAVNGLDYAYYQGIWNALPNFNSLTAIQTGTINNFNISGALQRDNYGFVFTGYINVPSNGTYTFYTNSDDGSKLFIGTTEVVANDGLHGTIEKSGQIGLKAGKHAVRVEFFERTSSSVLQVRYQGPGVRKQLIPNSALYRVPVFHRLIVENGIGDGNYEAGHAVAIRANNAPAGKVFDKWETNAGSPTIADIHAMNTSLTMPDNTAKVTATYKNVVAFGTGKITREVWTGISGSTIADLTQSINYPNYPNITNELTRFEAPTNWADNYGTRIIGYLHAPITGVYTFWIASDDNGELWLSTTDSPNNKRRIAYVPGWTNSRQWTRFAQQKSVTIELVAGQRYYIEALQKEGGGGDNLAVAWQLPGGSLEVIPGAHLSPYSIPEYALTVDNGYGDGNYEAGEIVTILANRAPAGKVFDKWVKNTGNPTIANINAASTSITMPANAAKVTATYKEAETPKNLVLASNGGVLRSYTSQYSSYFGASKLTDGITTDDGWFSAYMPGVQEFVYSFSGNRNATLDNAVIHSGRAGNYYYSKDVEVWVSANGIDYTKVGETTLAYGYNSRTIDLGGITAARVKLKITSGYRVYYWELGEFVVNGILSTSKNTTIDERSDEAITEQYPLEEEIIDGSRLEVIKLYPNPAKEELNIVVPFEDALIKIIDATGSIVKEVKFYERENRLNISDLPIGIYMIYVENDEGVFTERFIKQ
jgi:M6 family metalloprotease-like protein